MTSLIKALYDACKSNELSIYNDKKDVNRLVISGRSILHVVKTYELQRFVESVGIDVAILNVALQPGKNWIQYPVYHKTDCNIRIDACRRSIRLTTIKSTESLCAKLVRTFDDWYDEPGFDAVLLAAMIELNSYLEPIGKADTQ